MKNALLWTLVLTLAVVAGLACDSANPVAPSGTTLTISASPTQISLNGTSTITVVGRRPNGDPLSAGTEIRFSTSLGTIDAIVQTDGNGVARATLQADGRPGMATVSATTGGGSLGGGGGGDGEEGGGGGTTTGASVSIEILIGETDETRPSLTLSASPNIIFVEETSLITVIARAADGSPLEAGRTVILTTTLGSLDPARPVTQGDGTATATLSAGDQAGTATIAGIVGTSEEASTEVTIRDTATDLSLIASKDSVPAGAADDIALTAVVTNAQGVGIQQAQVTFVNNIGNVDPATAFTDGNGAATATLEIREDTTVEGQIIRVEARTAGVDPVENDGRIEAEVRICVGASRAACPGIDDPDN